MSIINDIGTVRGALLDQPGRLAAFDRILEAKGQDGSVKEQLRALVTALQNTSWSSWQSTARFNQELEDAERFLKENP